MIVSTGVEMVIPSAAEDSTWSAPARTPARRSRSASGTPSQRALPLYVPPTWFDTQTRVMSASVSGILSRSAKLISSSRPTIPSIFSVQVCGDSCGSTRSVSTR
jgi:hypothetical protein